MGIWWVTRRLNRLSSIKSRRVNMMNSISSSYKNLIHRRGFSMESKNDPPILPVLIVGAGPVGLVLSALLTKLGVKCAVLEKCPTFSTHPQAHFINNRSMEVFRKLDGLAEEIQRSQPPVDLWRKFIYCTSLTGSVIGSVDHMQPQDFDQIVSPVAVAHFSQYKLTALLLKELESLGFSVRTREGSGMVEWPLGERDVLMGHECTAIDATDDCISVTASFLKEGKNMEKEIKCKFLVGADGAGSAVRKLVGINMSGERDLQKLVSVHFLSRQLGQYLLNEKPGMLFFIFNTAAIGVLVAHDLNQGEFVLQVPFYPPQQKLEAFTSEMCEKLIFKLIGRELEDVNVLDIKPWVMHAEVAEKYLSWGNRVILAGDAAHRFPPAGGFGMNTGIQDAHNLAWKLALVLQGTAPASIIDTYDMERRPVALSNTTLSVQNFKAAMAVPTALGLDPNIANTVHEVINKTVGSILPSELQKTMLDGIFSIGRAQLSEFVLNENNPLGSSRLARVRHIFEEGKSLQLQFPAEDLGFRYLEGAIVPDIENESVLDPPEPPTGRRRDYVPSADPGSRLPHMNIRVLSKHSSQEVFSTLDLVSSNNVEFLLIISPVETSYRLARITLQVATEFSISVKVCVMWPNGAVDGDERTMVELAPWDNYIDVVEVRQPSNSLSWWNICKMTHRGAILVRPDEHVAWCVKSGMVSDIASVMRTVFSTVLRLESCRT